jgi:transcriptional regulator with XRE-family HTH domain
MEKKTIGKLIAALRRANGMTQRELGERLFVSDKTVSRWECDECTPELSLIPAIAELFGITTDELLRGECNAQAGADEGDDARQRKKGRSEKQFKVMLHRRMVRFCNQSMIVAGIALGGLLAAMVANLGFLRGIIGFCVGVLFLLAGGICQCCFTRNAYLQLEEEDDTFVAATSALNDRIVCITVRNMAVLCGVFAFLLPLVLFVPGAYYGLKVDSWLLLGALFAAIALAVYYVLYQFVLRPSFVSRGILSGKTAERDGKIRQLLKKMLLIVLLIAVLLVACAVIVRVLPAKWFAHADVFDNYGDFADFMKKGANYQTTLGYRVVTDEHGNTLCLYLADPNFYSSIHFSNTADRLPVAVYTQASIAAARDLVDSIMAALLLGIAVEAVICAVVYAIKLRKICRYYK